MHTNYRIQLIFCYADHQIKLKLITICDPIFYATTRATRHRSAFICKLTPGSRLRPITLPLTCNSLTISALSMTSTSSPLERYFSMLLKRNLIVLMCANEFVLITNWSTGCELDEEPRTFVTNALFPGLSVSLHASVYVQPTKLLLRCINHSRQ